MSNTEINADTRASLLSIVRLVAIASAVLAAIILLVGGGVRAPRELRVSFEANVSGGLQVFYDTGNGFSEAESVRHDFSPGSNELRLPLPEHSISALRLDPDPSRSLTLTLRELSIGRAIESDRSSVPLSIVRATNEISAIQRSSTGVVITPVSDAKDPQLVVPVSDDWERASTFQRSARVAQGILLALAFICVMRCGVRATTERWVPTLILAASALVMSMALASSTTVPRHPDERDHVNAAHYFDGHWRSPALDSEEVRGSYTVWGTTYLSEQDVVYMIAAKVSHLWSGLGLDETTALRLFQALLFLSFAVVAWKWPELRPGFAVALLTPQIWYVFSYFNADAFPFFLCLVVAALAAPSDSAVSRFINGGRPSLVALVTFAFALGLLMVSKRNFPPFILALGMLLATRHLGLRSRAVVVGFAGAALLVVRLVASDQIVYGLGKAAGVVAPAGVALLVAFGVLLFLPVFKDAQYRLRALKMALLFGAALCIALPKFASDMLANGGPAEKARLVQAMAERYAEPQFKPSTFSKDLMNSFAGSHFAQKGISLSQVVGAPYDWTGNSWRSSLGVYGYMNIFAPTALYWAASIGLCMFLLALVAWAFKHPDARPLLIVTAVCSALVALESMAHSWFYAFQPQGRYLLPAFAIAAMYVISQRGIAKHPLFNTGVLTSALTSLVAYMFVALPALSGR